MRGRGNPNIISVGADRDEYPHSMWGRKDWAEYEREREQLSPQALAAIAGPPPPPLTADEMRAARLAARLAKLGIRLPRVR